MEDGMLLEAFEAGRLDPHDFPHERHVRVAFALAARYDHDDALDRLRRGLHVIVARAGRPGAYHETLTRAWFELIREAASLDAHPELQDKRLLERYYSRDRLAAGRDRWVEPDLRPLRL